MDCNTVSQTSMRRQRKPEQKMYTPPAFRTSGSRCPAFSNVKPVITYIRSSDGGLLDLKVEGGENWDPVTYVRARNGMLLDIKIEGGEDWTPELLPISAISTGPDSNKPTAQIRRPASATQIRSHTPDTPDSATPQMRSWAEEVEEAIPLKEWAEMLKEFSF